MVKAKDKKNRMLEIFYRAMVGGNINTKALAEHFQRHRRNQELLIR